MAAPIQLEDLRRAWQTRDPQLADLIVRAAGQPDPTPDTPVREGALTFDGVLREIRSPAFHKKPFAEQAALRVERFKAVEAEDAEVPVPDRLRLYQVVLQLWQDNGPYARDCLLRVIAEVPLVYGPWRALKRVFKEAEDRRDTEIYGALATRFDAAYAGWGGYQVSKGTLGYLVRRGWRFLRRTGQALPATYADTAVDFLCRYTDQTNWPRTWVANHVFYHETKKYGRSSFGFWGPPPGNLLKNRAFAELWQRSPRPLFNLLERARSEMARDFATSALKADFRALLREVEPEWVVRLIGVRSAAVDGFVVWILQNVPRFEQAAFRSLGLHEAVLRLFDSPAPEARVYAAEYARTHARDLPVEELVRLANNEHDAVRKLVVDLLQSRDARRDVGLDAWGQLLETRLHDFAAGVIKKSFGASELTPEWFRDRLFAHSDTAFKFAKDYLPHVHPFEKLGAAFFQDLLDRCDEPSEPPARNVSAFALNELKRFDLNALDADFLRRLLLNPLTRHQVIRWAAEGRLRPQVLGADFLRNIAFHPGWEADPWLTAMRQGPLRFARQMAYDERLGNNALSWLSDVRLFRPDEVGMDWLLTLVARSEPRYHDFAVERLIKSFAPADFAPKAAAPATPQAAQAAAADLGGASFVFTGKLATMQRKEAEDKVKAAGGVVSSAVTAKLHYLVIGDEGSPLYGAGSKGAKQVKAEELNARGANIQIISETAFLQMLAGKKREHSADATLAGCERLWAMAIAPGPADAPLGTFARKYLRRHHPDLCQEETDRPVDAGTEVPREFFSFERVRPLFAESRKPLRDLALDLARWEFARWNPPAHDLVALCELPYPEVRKFVADALLAEDTPQTKRYRINPDVLSPAAVYSFCESPNEATRALGMQLIQRSERLQQPDELFRLTESPDRKVRAFVIRTLWRLYRDRGVTPGWKPPVPPQTTVGAAARKAATKAVEDCGPGVPERPEKRPAGDDALRMFLRRVLFEIPPGRMEPASEEDKGILARMKPLPARKAKLSLVDVMRDLALEDGEFASAVLPVLREFMVSFGRSERDACLVAVTRIRHRHAALAAI
jgi:hypothetical protein